MAHSIEVWATSSNGVTVGSSFKLDGRFFMRRKSGVNEISKLLFFHWVRKSSKGTYTGSPELRMQRSLFDVFSNSIDELEFVSNTSRKKR